MALGHNRLHRDIIPLGSSHARTGHAFIITHRTFFGVNQMNAVIRECLPPERLQVEESCKNQRLTGFTHTSTFLLTPSAKGTKMMYIMEGTFRNPIRDLIFKPIARGIMLEELFRIKHAIESSEPGIDLKSQTLEPI